MFHLENADPLLKSEHKFYGVSNIVGGSGMGLIWRLTPDQWIALGRRSYDPTYRSYPLVICYIAIEKTP